MKSSQNTTVCIKAGAIKASTDDATAPISDMKSSIFGMAAARPTARKKIHQIFVRSLSSSKKKNN